MASAHDMWAVGSALIHFSVFPTLIERWNGSSWSVVPSASPSVLTAAADKNLGQAWAGDFFNTTSSVQQTLAEFHP